MENILLEDLPTYPDKTSILNTGIISREEDLDLEALWPALL